MIIFNTTLGEIKIQLFEKEAPFTVENFRKYVNDGFFDGTIFHRVIPGFVVQGGGMTPDMMDKATRPPIKNEADNGMKNLRGTLSMARTQAKDSATSQFFINLADNGFLDNGVRDFGYAVFAKVVEGMNVVDKVASLKTGNKGCHSDVPLEPAILISAVEIPDIFGESKNVTDFKIRERIHSSVKREVWQRDSGKCVECGSNERLEFDHIIPVSKGGSNTMRNIQLLCEKCNRSKSSRIK